jgi:hypothetical protein
MEVSSLDAITENFETFNQTIDSLTEFKINAANLELTLQCATTVPKVIIHSFYFPFFLFLIIIDNPGNSNPIRALQRENKGYSRIYDNGP